MSSTVAVEDLRVGMYIHLEGGWLSHPFPLSAFRLTTQGEITTIRGLGLKHVRWVPEKSLLHDEAPAVEAALAPPEPSPEERAAQERQHWLAQQLDLRHDHAA